MTVNKIDWNGWRLTVNGLGGTILIQKDGEHRIYDIQNITKLEHEGQYCFIHVTNGNFYQVKFEDGNFLVIDLFDKDGEHLSEFGSHVFGEEL